MMVKQCAWCLRLVNSIGEPTSLLPVPKIHDATHCICRTCGLLWLDSIGGEPVVVVQMEDGRLLVQQKAALTGLELNGTIWN
jgi:hypothetical protein